MIVCAVCSEENAVIKSRLSPDSYLRHDRETGYTIYHYCKSCHLDLLANIWERLSQTRIDDNNPAPTAV